MTWITVFILMLLPVVSVGNQTVQQIAASDSMEPAIHTNDLLTIDATYYSSNAVQRFDVIIVERPMDNFNQPPQMFKVVARVIAMSGETVRIKNNKVFINGVALKEPYKIQPCSPQNNVESKFFPCSNFGPLKIPAGEFFLLADNRGGSEDGRLWKPHTIKKAQIKGKVIKVTRHF